GSAWVKSGPGPIPGAKNVRVKLDMGSVKIDGGSQAGITYVIHRRAYTGSEERARREFGSNRINASVKGDTAWVMAEGGGGRNRKCSDDLTISVPRSMELARLETGGGNVTATAINGRVELETGGGAIRVDDIGGGVRAETGGGSIEVGSVNGDANLETGGGNIKINSVKGEIKASTGGG